MSQPRQDKEGVNRRQRRALARHILKRLRRDGTTFLFAMTYASAMIMETYLNTTSGMYMGQTAFLADFGEFNPSSGQKEINSKWLLGFGLGNLGCTIVGSMVAGCLADKYGPKKVAVVVLLYTNTLVLGGLLVQSIEQLLAVNSMLGAAFGILSVIGITYPADVCSERISSYVLTYANITHSIGQLLAGTMMFSLQSWDSSWSYKLPWGLTWVLSIPISILILLAPDSPAWLVRVGALEKARRALGRLMPNDTPEMINERLQEYVRTEQAENARTATGTCWDLIRRPNRRATLLTALVTVSVWASGNALMSFGFFFLRTTGLPKMAFFLIPMVQCIFAIIASLGACSFVKNANRRLTFVIGLIGCATILLATGVAGLIEGNAKTHSDPALLPDHSNPFPVNSDVLTGVHIAAWAVAGLTIAYSIVRNLTMGPMTPILYTELPTARLRSKTMSLNRAIQSLLALLNALILPLMLAADKNNWSAKAAFVFAGASYLGAVFTWAFLPTTTPKATRPEDNLELA